MGASLSLGCIRCPGGKTPPMPDLATDTVTDFTEEEKQLINSTWKHLDEKTSDMAVDIFLRIFELRPDVKEFFPFSKAVGDALVNHPYFKGHSMRFINAVKMTVTNLDALEVIHVPNLRKLGHYHTKIPGFTRDIFQVFYYAMDHVWAKYLRRTYSRKTRRAWLNLFAFIIGQVEYGYREGLEENDRKSPKTPTAVEVSENHTGKTAELTAVTETVRETEPASVSPPTTNSSTLNGGHTHQDPNGSAAAITLEEKDQTSTVSNGPSSEPR